MLCNPLKSLTNLLYSKINDLAAAVTSQCNSLKSLTNFFSSKINDLQCSVHVIPEVGGGDFCRLFLLFVFKGLGREPQAVLYRLREHNRQFSSGSG